MIRSSSLPEYKYHSNGLNVNLPKITKNPWITNSSTASDYKYKRGDKYLPKNYAIMNKDKLNAIENNYYEMRYFLNDKINRLEKNQRKFNEILQYSLAQNRLQNDINNFNYDKHLQNYKDKNIYEKEYLINMINQMPEMIEKKLDRIFMSEIESSRNQKKFIKKLEEKMMVELKNQRRYDYLKYKQQLDDLMQMKDFEEKEKMRLLNKIQQQKILNKLREIQYQNDIFRYNPYAAFPYYQFNPFNMRQNSIGPSIDEFMKVMMFKEMMGSFRFYNDYQNYLNDYFNPDIYDPLLFDSEGYKRYKKLKDKLKNRKSSYEPTLSSKYSQYKKLYNEGKYLRSDNNKIPFINSGKSYIKINDKYRSNKKRFVTSHNETNKKSKQEEKKPAKKSSKSNKKTESEKSKKDKSKSNGKESSGSESEDHEEENSKSESGDEGKAGDTKKKEGSEKKDTTDDKDKKEDSKDEEKSDDEDNEGGEDDDDDDDNNEEEEKKDENQQQPQNEIVNPGVQPQQLQLNPQPQQLQLNPQPQQLQLNPQPQQIQMNQQPQ